MNNLSDIFDRHKKSVVDFIDGVRKTAYQQGRAEAIEEFAEKLFDELVPMRDKKFDIAKGTAMPERYTHLKVMDTLDMIIEMVKIMAEQLKEQRNE